MDIAYYISDLLGQQGELSVPNLGYFVQTRISAKYDEGAKQFFPPYYALKFDPRVIDDNDTLADYIAGLKKISLASAKYFIEKYTGNLKSQVVTGAVPFANLGSFSSDGIQLTFHPGAKTDDPAFFAYAPIEAYKITPANDNQSASSTIAQVETPVQPAIQPVTGTYIPPTVAPVAPVVEEAPLNTTIPEEAIYEEAPARSTNMWIILLIVVAVLAIAFAAIYKFRPDLVKEIFPPQKAAITDTKPVTIPAVSASVDTTTKTDTAKATVNNAASSQKLPAKTTSTTVAAPATAIPANTAQQDTIAKGSWVIYSQSFPTKSGADHRVDVLQGKGFTQARLLKYKVNPGSYYKVILGAFKTHAEALSKSQELMATGKIKQSEISVELYK